MKYFLPLLLLAMLAVGCDRDDGGNSLGGTYVPSGISVNSQNVLGAGVRQVYGEIEYPQAFDVDSAGANRTWRFSDFDWAGNFSLTYLDPEDCPFNSHFPTATRAVDVAMSYAGEDWEYNLFERVDSRGIWDLGAADQTDYEVYDTPTCRLELPCTFGTSWAETERDSSGYSGYWSVYVDSLIWTCDAWGWIITPYDSCRALRGSEVYLEYYRSSYDTTWQLEWTDRNYYWIDQHGDIVMWVSSSESTADPYFDNGYVNMRLSKEDVSTTAGPVATGHLKRPAPDVSRQAPQHARSFMETRLSR